MAVYRNIPTRAPPVAACAGSRHSGPCWTGARDASPTPLLHAVMNAGGRANGAVERPAARLPDPQRVRAAGASMRRDGMIHGGAKHRRRRLDLMTVSPSPRTDRLCGDQLRMGAFGFFAHPPDQGSAGAAAAGQLCADGPDRGVEVVKATPRRLAAIRQHHCVGESRRHRHRALLERPPPKAVQSCDHGEQHRLGRRHAAGQAEANGATVATNLGLPRNGDHRSAPRPSRRTSCWPPAHSRLPARRSTDGWYQSAYDASRRTWLEC